MGTLLPNLVLNCFYFTLEHDEMNEIKMLFH